MSDRLAVMKRMRELTAEYNELKDRLAVLDAEEYAKRFEVRMRALLEEWKGKYTVEANDAASPIDWAKVESLLFSEENLSQARNPNPEGWFLGYDNDGMPGLAMSYHGGSVFTPYAYDEIDAKRYLERQAQKEENKKRGKR